MRSIPRTGAERPGSRPHTNDASADLSRRRIVRIAHRLPPCASAISTTQRVHQPSSSTRTGSVYLTYFNAGLRIIDIADARLPREVGYFVPPDPTRRYGTLPKKLVVQSEDVLVDARGYIYLTEKNQGLWILQYTGLR